MIWSKAVVIFMIVFIAIFGSTGCGCGGDSQDNEETEQQQVIKVERGTLETTISAFGNVSMPHQARLSFGINGTLQDLDVEFGDKVSQGDVLARLEVGSLQRAVAGAEVDLRVSEVNLEQANPDTGILEAEATVETASASLAGAELAYEQALEYNLYDAETEVDNARSQLESTELVAEIVIDQAEQQLISAWDSWDTYVMEQGSVLPNDEVQLLRHEEQMMEDINDAINNLRVARENPGTAIAEAEAGIDAAEEQLSNLSLDDLAIRKAEANLNQARIELAYIKEGYDILEQTSDESQIDTGVIIDRAEDELKKARSSIGDLMQQHIDTLLGDYYPSTEEEELLSAIKTAVIELQVAEENADAQIASAEANLSAAERALEGVPIDIQEKESSVASAEAALARAQNELANALDGLNIETLELAVQKARLALEDARSKLEDGMIIAPFDGTAARVDTRVGDQIVANTVVIYLVDTSRVEIDASVDEVDIADVHVGQEAEISFDSMPNITLTGKVTAVSPVAEKTSGLVTYNLTVEIEDAAEVELKEGMTASVDIQAVLAENAVLVPNAAIQKLGDTGVEVVTLIGDDGLRREQMVETGASNGRYTEILSGLEEGDRIVAGAGVQIDEDMMECIERLMNDPCVEKLMKLAEEYGIEIPQGGGGFGDFGGLTGN